MACIPKLPLNGSTPKHKAYIFHILCVHTTSVLRICVVRWTQSENVYIRDHDSSVHKKRPHENEQYMSESLFDK